MTYFSIKYDLFQYKVCLISVLSMTYFSIKYGLFQYKVWLISVLSMTYFSIKYDLFHIKYDLFQCAHDGIHHLLHSHHLRSLLERITNRFSGKLKKRLILYKVKTNCMNCSTVLTFQVAIYMVVAGSRRPEPKIKNSGSATLKTIK